MSPLRRLPSYGTLALACTLLLTADAAELGAQTLRGSKAKVDKAYQFARRRGIDFTTSRAEVTSGAREGEYVKLRGGTNYRLKGVTVPYVLPATRDFVVRLSAQYRKACKTPMVVTSAIRPTSLQKRLPNGAAKSVHPTGMAVDLRAPVGSCRPWLRRTLLAESKLGRVDATEERNPAHFHVIVYR